MRDKRITTATFVEEEASGSFIAISVARPLDTDGTIIAAFVTTITMISAAVVVGVVPLGSTLT